MTRTTWILAALLAGTTALSGCNKAPQATAAPAQLSNETFQEFGNHEIHFNAVRTDSLTADIARAYGIQRSSNRVMLNVAILRKQADHAPRKPVDGIVQVDAYNLNGQLKNLEMRRISEGDAIYYIGEVSISGTEILVFDISVTPDGEARPFEVKFKREFYSG
jgi:hypothetical protein